jgi:hypothetical protein
MSLLPFDELVSGATVRYTVKDGVQYLSIRDLIMVVCEKDGNHAQEVWRRLPDDKKSEVHAFCVNFRFPGRGQSEQPVITFPGAIKIMMWLPGDNAKKFRTKAAEIITRYYAGDKSLLKEIEANAESEAPIHKMARAALDNDSDSLMKQKFDQIELVERVELVKKRKLDNVASFCDLMERLRPDWKSDQRLVLQTEDWVKNAAFTMPLTIENGPATGVVTNLHASISIGQVARELGMGVLRPGDIIRVGRQVAQTYRARYGREPPTHKQWVDGAERDVKSYTEADRDLVEAALKQLVE